jgi:hypothetical protein
MDRCRSGKRWACGGRGSQRPSSGASLRAARRLARAGARDPPPRRAVAPATEAGPAGRTT